MPEPTTIDELVRRAVSHRADAEALADAPNREAIDGGAPQRLTWAEVVAVGPNVRSMEAGDQVLFNPEDRYEVEVRGKDYIILRERDIHAVAAERLDEGSTGLYL